MLLELKVSNFAIIDNVQINFGPGLNILSGETGAGKSILLKSLGLLMGEKGLADSVRTGSEVATIEGFFDLHSRPDIEEKLTNMGIEVHDDQLVVRRVISAQNKSRIYLNGSLSTLSALRDVVSPLVEVTSQAVPLIEMTGQHDNRHLLSKAYHLDILDQYAGIWKMRGDVAEKFARLQELQNEIDEMKAQDRNQAQRLDFLIYQRDEIKALDLKSGEEEEIEAETKRLKFSSRLQDFVSQTENMLYGDDDSVTSRLHYILQRAGELRNLDASLTAKLEPLSQAKTLISEVNYDLRDYARSLDADPSRLEDLEQRLSRLRQLQKKYGATADDILLALGKIETEIDLLENSDLRLREKEDLKAVLYKELETQAKFMHEKREKAALKLAKGVNEELKDLNMKGLEFIVDIEWTNELHATGQSSVEFMTKTSQSDAPKPMAKFASGGEMSRILLALKQVVGHSTHPRTYLFDEVDTGVSGPTAEKVGRKLKSIAKNQQVICVTHLPQVASFGDQHFFICKNANSSTVKMEITSLSGAERVKEIARLISGEKITKTSLAHAEQLLQETQG